MTQHVTACNRISVMILCFCSHPRTEPRPRRAGRSAFSQLANTNVSLTRPDESTDAEPVGLKTECEQRPADTLSLLFNTMK